MVLDPAAPYRDGVLSLLVIEARITAVRVQGLDGLRAAYVIDRLQRPEDGILNGDVLRERLQRLSEDPLFAHVDSQLVAGSEPGEAILEVGVQRARTYTASLALNNYRPPAIGEKAYELNAQVRDVTGLGDVIDAGLSGPIVTSGGIGYGLECGSCRLALPAARCRWRRRGTTASSRRAAVGAGYPQHDRTPGIQGHADAVERDAPAVHGGRQRGA